MSLEEMKAKYFWAREEAWLKGNLDALDEYTPLTMSGIAPRFRDLVGLDGSRRA